MKRILIPAALALALCGGIAVAQQAEGRHKQHDPHKTAVKMAQKLNLTPDQVTQVKAIDADTMKQMMALHSDTSLTPDEKKPKMMEIHKASQDKIRGLLTTDQQTKFDALQAEMREHRGHHGGGAPPPPPPPQ